MINRFKNIKSPQVIGEIDVYDYLDRIKKPDSKTLSLIEEARNAYTYDDDRDMYDLLKSTLPCFTLNFSFNHSKKNENVKEATGFIYLDVDGCTEIDLSNEYIFASWKSLSNAGRGILVQVKGLTLGNFKDTYTTISQNLNLPSDIHAGKATQYCVHSYDKDLYCNNNALTWVASLPPTRSYPYSSHKRKGNPKMGEKESNLKIDFTSPLRFNNIDDFDFKGKDYIYFEDEKEFISNVIIPKNIKAGGRNSIMYAIAYQIKALNPSIDDSALSHLVHSVNYKRCQPPLKKSEIDGIVRKVDQLEDIGLVPNVLRRIIFNPESTLTPKEKSKITNTLLGKKRCEKTMNEIKECLDQWDVERDGKVTQQSLAKVSEKNIKTIEKYYHFFEKEREVINQCFVENLMLNN